MHKFWSHHEDSYSVFKTVVDFEELGKVDYAEIQFATGVVVNTNSPRFKKVFESEEEIFKYIDIYSIQSTFGPETTFGDEEYENKKRLEFGCP